MRIVVLTDVQQYDDAPLYAAFKARAVPERSLIYRAFFGGRFGV